MLSKNLKVRAFGKILVAIAAGIFLAQMNSGGEPYLKVAGPTPLRFEVMAPRDPVFIAELTLPRLKNSTAPAMSASTGSTPGGKEPGQGTSPANSAEAGSAHGNFAGPAKNAANAANAASELLNITPQMIGEYLKPNPSDISVAVPSPFQPGQSILVPAELGFVPPMPGGNRAIYISK